MPGHIPQAIDICTKQQTRDASNMKVTQTVGRAQATKEECLKNHAWTHSTSNRHMHQALDTYCKQYKHYTNSQQSTSHQRGGFKKSCLDTLHKQYTHFISNIDIPQAICTIDKHPSLLACVLPTACAMTRLLVPRVQCWVHMSIACGKCPDMNF